MIIKAKYGDYVVYTKEGSDIYNEIFTEFVNNRIKTEKIFRSNDNTKVSLIKFKSKRYVLKIFKPNDKKVERFFKSFFKGDYYLNLIKKTDEARSNGIKFPNDFYLLAEKKIFNYASLFIMIIEYIPGVELGKWDSISDEIKSQITTNISNLHANGMVSGDLHKDNFIFSENGLRLIDLSGKKISRKRIAQDYIDLERNIGITDFDKDFFYHFEKKRSLLRKRLKEMKSHLRSA